MPRPRVYQQALRQANGTALGFLQLLTSHLDSWATNFASASFSMVASVRMLG